MAIRESDVLPTLNNTVGALLVGVVIASVLFGVTSLQAYLYFHRYRKDPILHKISVATLWILDTFHQALTVHLVYHYIVSAYRNPSVLHEVVWSLKLQVSINVAIILLVQSLYTWRVYRLSGYYRGLLGYLAVGAVLGGFAIGIILAYKAYTVSTFDELQSVSWAVESSLASSTAIDFVIAFTMVWYLHKSKSPSSHLNSRIGMLMQYFLGSGILISAASTAALVTYVTMPTNMIFLAIELTLTKLYTNSFLAMFNARSRTRSTSSNPLSTQQFDSSGHPITALPTLSSGRFQTQSGGRSQEQSHRHEVSIITEVHTDRDVESEAGGDQKRSDSFELNYYNQPQHTRNLSDSKPTYAVGW